MRRDGFGPERLASAAGARSRRRRWRCSRAAVPSGGTRRAPSRRPPAARCPSAATSRAMRSISSSCRCLNTLAECSSPSVMQTMAALRTPAHGFRDGDHRRLRSPPPSARCGPAARRASGSFVGFLGDALGQHRQAARFGSAASSLASSSASISPSRSATVPPARGCGRPRRALRQRGRGSAGGGERGRTIGRSTAKNATQPRTSTPTMRSACMPSSGATCGAYLLPASRRPAPRLRPASPRTRCSRPSADRRARCRARRRPRRGP